MINRYLIEDVYRKDYRFFLMLAYSITRQLDISEDAVQEGFIGVLGFRDQFVDRGHVRAYLVGCIKNASFSRLKKEKRQAAIRRDFVRSYDEQIHRIENWPIGPGLLLRIYRLKNAMHRRVLEDLYINGRSLAQLERATGSSRMTIRRYEAAGLNSLIA